MKGAILAMKRIIITIFSLMIISVAGNAQEKDLHNQYAGDIIFSNSELTLEKIEDKDYKDRFGITETIYGRAFLEKPLATYYDEYNWKYDFEMDLFDYNYAVIIYIDGKEMIRWLDEMPPEVFKQNTIIDFAIAPERHQKYEYSLTVSDWIDAVEQLENGNHLVEVEIKAMSVEQPGIKKPALSKGSFTLQMDGQMLQTFKNKFKVGLPEPTMLHQEVEEGILVASKNMYPGLTPVEAVIVEPAGEWQYAEDMEGNILNRSFIAVVAYSGFENECFVHTARYTQDHLGNNQWDDVRLSQKLQGYYDYEIPCENIK